MPWLLGLQIVADVLLVTGFLSMALTLLAIARRKKDKPLHPGIRVFVLALLAGGIVHLFHVWNVWQDDHGIASVVKLLAGVIAAIAAVLLHRARADLIALITPRPVAEVTGELERRIVERTHELAEANAALGRANADLQQKEERLQLVIRGNNEGVWQWDIARNEILLSDKVYEILRLSPPGEPETRQTIASRLQTVDTTIPTEQLRAHVEEGKAFAFEHPFRRDDGSIVWLRVRGESQRDAAGKVVRMAGSVSDIDKERRALESMLFQTHILSQVNDAVIAVDLEQKITYWNTAAERLYGFSSAEALGRPVTDAYRNAWREPEHEHLAVHSLEMTGHWQGEVMHTLRDGRQLSVEASIVRLRDNAGHHTGLLSVIRDVTKQRELEEQVRAAQRLESIGLLAGGVAHDFNNLLQVIQGYTSLCLDAEMTTEERAENLGHVKEAANRATQLTTQLLAFSRKQALQKADLDLNLVIEELLKMIRRLIGEQIYVDFIAGHELGNVRADRGQLEQVLLNLCINARDAMPRGGRLTIETENILVNGAFRQTHPWAKAGRYVLMSVTDTGIGMDRETQRRIFEPFFTTKARGRGTGLGLAVVYGVVKQHEGMIHVYSELGVGTTFKIYLPIANRGATTPGTKLSPIASRGTETILVAEDDPQVRQLAVHILERAGYRVLVASDGPEACEIFAQHADEVALLVLDVVMPRFGGRDVYERVSVQRAGLPVVYCSGYTGAALSPDALHAPGAQLLAKPYSADDLLACVRGALDRHLSGKN